MAMAAIQKKSRAGFRSLEQQADVVQRRLSCTIMMFCSEKSKNGEGIADGRSEMEEEVLQRTRYNN